MAVEGAERVVQNVLAALDKAGLSYMPVGAFASSMHGEPRSTQDIDVVVVPDGPALERFLKLLPVDEYYFDLDTARRAVRTRSMFNVIETSSSWKIDVIVQKDDDHARVALDRRVRGRLGSVELFVESAEDTMLSKLRWARQSGGSERQLRDVAGIRKVAGPSLDREYLGHWIARLGLEDLWAQTA